MTFQNMINNVIQIKVGRAKGIREDTRSQRRNRSGAANRITANKYEDRRRAGEQLPMGPPSCALVRLREQMSVLMVLRHAGPFMASRPVAANTAASEMLWTRRRREGTRGQ